MGLFNFFYDLFFCRHDWKIINEKFIPPDEKEAESIRSGYIGFENLYIASQSPEILSRLVNGFTNVNQRCTKCKKDRNVSASVG